VGDRGRRRERWKRGRGMRWRKGGRGREEMGEVEDRGKER